MWESINKEGLKKDLQSLLSDGIKSLAVVLLHSYTFNDHEKEVGQLAKEMGFTHVSLSSEVMPMVRIVPRGYTGRNGIGGMDVISPSLSLSLSLFLVCADAYLTPCIKRYVKGFCSGFKDPVSITLFLINAH